MTTNPTLTKRQMRWYGTPYKPSREQTRKDIEDYLRWLGIIPEEPSCNDGTCVA
jgi:hypothetical protein